MLFAQGVERGPVDAVSRRGQRDFLDAQEIVHGLELGGAHGTKFLGRRQFIELCELDAETADADAELMTETT